MGGEEWKFGLCQCFSNFGICIMATIPFLDLFVLGDMVVEAETCDSCFGAALGMFVPFYGAYLVLTATEKVRQKHNIDGSCFGDFMKYVLCGPLYLTQVRAQQVRGMGEDIERQ